MSHTFARNYLHITFSTRGRRKLIPTELQSNLFSGRRFSWQDGYAAFSVSTSNLESVSAYIRGQPEHHKRRTFEEEFRAFLNKNGIPFDPERVFG